MIHLYLDITDYSSIKCKPVDDNCIIKQHSRHDENGGQQKKKRNEYWYFGYINYFVIVSHERASYDERRRSLKSPLLGNSEYSWIIPRNKQPANLLDFQKTLLNLSDYSVCGVQMPRVSEQSHWLNFKLD